MSGKRGIIALMIAVAALAVLLAMLFSGAVYAEEREAKELTQQTTVTSEDDPEGLANLTDKNMATRYVCAAGTTVKLECDEPASQLYVILDRPVEGYTVSFGGKTLQCGKDGFLHEYIALGEAAKEIELTFTAEKTMVCELYLFGEGETPDWVQKWMPPYEDADMLLLPTHADDEHLWFGGTMPYYAGELGRRVQVAYMTNHWGDRRRPHELLNGLWLVGVRAYPVISDFPDAYAETLEQAESIYGRENILEWQVEQLRRFKPEVVIAQDIDGEYGHGAHRLNAATALEAAPLAADAAVFPESAEKYGVWELPKLYMHLYPENQLVMDWSVPLESFGGKTGLEMAKEGYLEHESQQYCWFEVKDSGKLDCRKFGLAYTTVVTDDPEIPDFLQNITIFSGEYAIIEESTQEESGTESSEQELSEAESSEMSVQEQSAPPEDSAPEYDQQTDELPEEKDIWRSSFGSPVFIALTAAVVVVIIAALLAQIYSDRRSKGKDKGNDA